LNAANEVAVDAFLNGNLPWLSIADVLDEALDLHDGTVLSDIESVIDVDRRARLVTRSIVDRRMTEA
jgi:1-deoxy-D-xylulose-5-phosphate reductoisomerase